ncbi:MAG: cyclic nucleotide-binding domain-containing protein [Alphaproteobacteria bacterium]
MQKLKKVSVSSGISWVEVPEADVYILCGCPADAVKHLMRRGLIVPTEVGGVPCETGPNVILLSDVMLQNGAFCNLGEFPVLQMLYRQGMLLPGHPNNIGTKPLLVGMREQVDVQLRYIYRGNYGLISREEIIEAGVGEAEADELMRLKLRFAFGRIRDSRELLDALYLGNDPVEIRNGVMVRRVDLNLFQVSYGNESVTVDLNLPAGASYELPYPLGIHQMRREYFAVLHMGDGDGWDVNRPSMGSIVMFQERIFLVDAGPNLQNQLSSLGIGINEIDGLFLTHAHDDHFAGVTTLLRADRRIKLYSTPLVRASAARKLSSLMNIDEKSLFDYFDVQDLIQGQWNNIAGLEVMPVFSPHPVETTVFHFRALWEGGYRMYAHFADIVSLDVLKGMVTDDPAAPGVSRELYDRVVTDYMVPADVKKLDIGGGLIHGRATDFRDDTSKKLILAHTSRPLLTQEKEIGSGAPFGTMDVLIRGHQNFTWRNAHEWLRVYFPTTPLHELWLLLNNPIATYNPEAILMHENKPVEHIYLVLTGIVEAIRSGRPTNGELSAGTFLGEMSAIEDSLARNTYRTASFVQAVVIPADLYRAFVKRNDLLGNIRAIQERRSFLRSTSLCGDGVSNTVLNRLAQEMPLVFYEPGEVIDPQGELMLVRSGRVELSHGRETIESLEVGDFFGEATAVFETPTPFEAVVREPSHLYALPGSLLQQVPVLRWKLLETFEKRMFAAATHHRAGHEQTDLHWQTQFNLDVPSLDAHHRKILELTNQVLRSITHGRSRSRIAEDVSSLLDFTRFHFSQEEAMLREANCQDMENHVRHHQQWLKDLEDLQTRFAEEGLLPEENVVQMLRVRTVDHILADKDECADLLKVKRGS